tara:strand:- start:84091 stop:84753 length:663 start_codon:yes stop_codon:yes gene_type:complete
MKKLLPVVALLISGFAMAESVNQDVSVGKYNTFVFDKPYKKIVFEPGSRVEEPIPLSGNDGFLLRVEEGAHNAFQLVVELTNGETVEFVLEPTFSESGATYRRNGAGTFSEPEGQRARPSDGWVVETMKQAYLHQTPVGFMEEGEPKYAKLGDTELMPIKRYTNNLYELMIFEVRSETPKEIQPRDFWHEGVEAVQLEGDIVSPQHRPTLFILKEVKVNG